MSRFFSSPLAIADWLAAVLPLVGVVVGAATTGWVSWWFASRTEDAELQQARRRVAVELGRLAQDLGAVLRANRLNVREGFFETSVWAEEQRVLARHLSESDWEAIALVFENVKATDQLLSANLGKSLPPSVGERCTRLLHSANHCRVLLGTHPVPVEGVTPPSEESTPSAD